MSTIRRIFQSLGFLPPSRPQRMPPVRYQRKNIWAGSHKLFPIRCITTAKDRELFVYGRRIHTVYVHWWMHFTSIKTLSSPFEYKKYTKIWKIMSHFDGLCHIICWDLPFIFFLLAGVKGCVDRSWCYIVQIQSWWSRRGVGTDWSFLADHLSSFFLDKKGSLVREKRILNLLASNLKLSLFQHYVDWVGCDWIRFDLVIWWSVKFPIVHPAPINVM